MKVIFKYPFQGAVITLQLPRGSELLTIQTQQGIPVFWFLQDNESVELEIRSFLMRTTGNPYDQATNEKYVGTVQLDDESFVGHVFELI